MNKERIRRLNEIGFCWDLNAALWESKFRELKKFLDAYGGSVEMSPLARSFSIREAKKWKPTASSDQIKTFRSWIKVSF